MGVPLVRLSAVRCFCLLLLAVVGVASRADATPIVVPPSLSPGDIIKVVIDPDNAVIEIDEDNNTATIEFGP